MVVETGQAWANNTGGESTDQVVSPALGAVIRKAAIYKRRRFSDHAPLTIDYEWPAVDAPRATGEAARA